VIKEYSVKFLKGSLVKLRKIDKNDIEKYKEIESNMENRLLMNDGIPFPPTDNDHEKFVSEISADKEDYMFAIELTEEKTFIGTIAVYLINWKNGTCHVGISIGSDYQGQGLGTDAMNVMLDYIFNYLNINKVKLSVFSFNNRAILSYEKCGFQLEGTLKEEIFRFGKNYDVILMGILREDWKMKQR